MRTRPKVLFLYTELAAYFIACLEALDKYADIAVVRWPLNKEAPFKFEFDPNWIILDRQDFDKKTLIEFSRSYTPDVLICSGWVDPVYNALASYWHGKIPTVLTLDNHFTGSLKQHIGRLVSRYFLRSRFTKVWVPGQPQRVFARKLGFKKQQIYDGFYSADTEKFNAYFNQSFKIKKKKFPKRFLYLGRYVEFKGIVELWNAFIEANAQVDTPWELYCLGTGDLWEQRSNHKGIKHMGFVQPDQLLKYIEQTGVFVLPSHKEPWGVAVHEMAVAGFPMLLSNKIGAASRFLDEGKNGFQFEVNHTASLTQALLKMMRKSDRELVEMGTASHQLGLEHSPEKWVQTVLSFL